MAELKTKPTEHSVDGFLDSVSDESRPPDCRAVLALTQRVTGAEPKLWGTSMVGFDSWGETRDIISEHH